MAKMTGHVRGKRLFNENGYKAWLWRKNDRRQREINHLLSYWNNVTLSTTVAGMRANEKIRLKMSVRNGNEYERGDLRRYIRDLC